MKISDFYINSKYKVVDFKAVLKDRIGLSNVDIRKLITSDEQITLEGLRFFKKLFKTNDISNFINDIQGIIEYYKDLIIDDSISTKKATKKLKNSIIEHTTQKLITQFRLEKPNQRFLFLPSISKDPRHSHMLYYYKEYTFKTGAGKKGIIPQQEFGCKCQMSLIA